MDVLGTLRQLLEVVTGIRQDLDFGSYPSRFIAANLGALLDTLRAFVFSTQDPFDRGQQFIQAPPIRQFMPLAQATADAGLTAVVTWGFFRIMWGRSNVRNKHALRLLLPRACLAALLINCSPVLVQSAVEASNALTQVVMDAAPGDHLRAIQVWFSDAGAPGLQAVALLVLFVSYGLLAIVYVMRFALLVILAILAPLAALLLVMPETQRFAREWGHLFATTLLMQPLQLLIVQVGFSLDASFENVSPYPVRHLFAICAVYIALRVPGALNTSTRVGTRAYSIGKREANHAYKAALKALAKVTV
jgi:hypothetical protein